MPRPVMATLYDVVHFLKASPRRSSRPLSATTGGNPRPIDQKTATRLCRLPLGGVILGGVHGFGDQWMFSSMERCFILHIEGNGSRRRGALVIRRLMCEDGLAQEGNVVWRRGGVDVS
ncbi:Flavin-containing monooxygenase FMO GS-OX5 [Hordeum vulgare]|nr:Flavin-containing monooxygenase FMO GS-OX5 [Hordeum vulgare]